MGGGARRRLQGQMMQMTKEQIEAYRAEQKIQREVLAKQKNEYRQFQFKNPYANMENQFEDLKVDTKAAGFQMEQGAQQRANIMQGLRGAAGGSGVAGLAQALANQGQMQSRQVSVDIGRQEQSNQAMAMKGRGAADMAQRGGEAMVQSAEMQRQSTLLGIEYGGMQGANAGVQAAYGNQMSAFGASANMVGSQMGMVGDVVAGVGAAAGAKLPLACIPKGINIDCVDGVKSIENIKPGDIVIGYNGSPVKVLQKHEYLENPIPERFYKVKFEGENGKIHEVDVCDMHRIKGVRSKDITENVISKELYNGVKFSYDLLTEDLGYRISGIPVNSMIEEMALLTSEILNNK